MYFIGVTTGSSSMLRLFPRWAEALGLDAELVGHDLPLDASPDAYREIVARIKSEAHTRGALVTTHKINLLRASKDLFDTLDADALLCDEVSSISKRGGRLEGHALDPISSGLTWRRFVPRHHFRDTGASVLCLGAGGAAIAISVAVARLEDAPERFVCVDRDAARLEMLRRTHAQLKTGVRFEYLQNEHAPANDALLASLGPGSVVINATGMGKDRPGSPITSAGIFPERGLVWELNYRGSLEFLHEARAQQTERGLTLEDGWVYFLHGWTQVIAQVFDLEITPELFARLEALAESVRP